MNCEKRLNTALNCYSSCKHRHIKFNPFLRGSLSTYVNCLLLLRIIIKMYTYLNFRIFLYNANQVIRPLEIILKIALFLHVQRNQHIVMKKVYHRSFESPIPCLSRLSRIQFLKSKEKKNINIIRWNKLDQTQIARTRS